MRRQENTTTSDDSHAADGESQPLLPASSVAPTEIKPEYHWYHNWDLSKNLGQVFVRERNPELFAIDAFRALGFLWIVNSHLQEGLEQYYTNFPIWLNNNVSKAVGRSAAEGVTIFFVISGFLNIMVTEGITRRNKEEHLSWRGIATFMFRRCCHLPPNLYVIVVVALIYGCTSATTFSEETFCTPCLTGWWTNFVFINNFTGFFSSTNCFNSTWTVSAQMQLYITSIPVFYAYSVKKSYGYAACALFTIVPILLRVSIIQMMGSSLDYQTDIYLPFYTRADAYGLGMALYMLYTDYLKVRPKNDFLCESVYQRITTATAAQLTESTILWGVAITTIYLGLVNIFSSEVPSFITSMFSVNVAYQYQSYSLFIVAFCAVSIAFVALEGTLWPLSWFMQAYIWYPIASLSYTGYLFSLMVSFQYAGIMLSINGGNTAIWTGNFYDYLYIYCEVIVFVLVCGLCLSLLVEKPFLNIARATNF